ncbi:MAG TPA: MFS transporter [Allosphingosinicella sp.]|nr:MFS transporter [Allosphingosinicella sp.]
MAATQLTLLKSRRFSPFMAAHFQSVFCNNLFKTSMLILVAFSLFEDRAEASSSYAMLALGIYALPHILLAAVAGQIADLIDKARLVRIIKVAELFLMLLALLALQLQSLPLLLAVLLGVGAKGAFLAALEYSLLPQLLERRELLAGTGLMQAGAVIAVLTGQIAGGLMSHQSAGVILVLLAAAGMGASWLIPPAPSSRPDLRPDWNLLAAVVRVVKPPLGERALRTAMLGISWFYVVGALFTSQLAPLIRNNLGAEPEVVSAFLAMFVLGTAAGAVAVHMIMRGSISARLLPAAMAVLGLFTMDFWLGVSAFPPGGRDLLSFAELVSMPPAWRLLADLLGVGAAASVMVVPLYGVLQTAGPVERRGRDVAANNILNAVAVLLATGLVAAAVALGASIPSLFLLLGLSTLAIAGGALLLPRGGAAFPPNG